MHQSQSKPPGIRKLPVILKAALEELYTSQHIIQNQQMFSLAMTKVLHSVIGFSNDQIGLASFNLMYGICGENGIVEPGCISVNAVSEKRAFHKSVDDYQSLEGSTEDAPHVGPFVIIFDDEHFPILLSWDDEEGKPLSDMRALLTSYFDKLWKCACDSDSLLTPWDSIEKCPEAYFDLEILPVGFQLMRPVLLTWLSQLGPADPIQVDTEHGLGAYSMSQLGCEAGNSPENDIVPDGSSAADVRTSKDSPTVHVPEESPVDAALYNRNAPSDNSTNTPPGDSQLEHGPGGGEGRALEAQVDIQTLYVDGYMGAARNSRSQSTTERDKSMMLHVSQKRKALTEPLSGPLNTQEKWKKSLTAPG
ncbi:hypothetical protein BC827DRAFT_1159553 [Russula dissimulans]|nr:hypothetical protein BC827DRAFT_1159553 [Russula dissimulans]